MSKSNTLRQGSTGFFLLLLVMAAPGLRAQDSLLEPSQQGRILAGAAALIRERYVDESKAVMIAETLETRGTISKEALEPEDFAQRATELMRVLSGDPHLGLSFSENALDNEQAEQRFSKEELDKFCGPEHNYGIEKIERLPSNILLLELRAFPEKQDGGEVLSAAMNVVAGGEALIIDLRNNSGGGDTDDLLMGYLLPPNSPVSGSYNRPNDAKLLRRTPAEVSGQRFGEDKPLYILTSPKTFSAAERVAYDLQALKRAVIVGEATGGGAQPFEYRRVSDHFALELPESRSVNPITGSNWERVGVIPDVIIPSDKALDAAISLAEGEINGPIDSVTRHRPDNMPDGPDPL